MIFLNSLIIAALLGFIIRSLIIVVKDMDVRKKQILNGIIILFIFFIVYISLLTYKPDRDPLENFGGIIGAYIARSIYENFGISSYLIPFILVIASISLLMNKTKIIFYKFGGLFVWLFFVLMLTISIIPGVSPAKEGKIGVIVGNFLLEKLTISGSIALISFIFLIIIFIYLHSVFKLKMFSLEKILKWRTRKEKGEKVTRKIEDVEKTKERYEMITKKRKFVSAEPKKSERIKKDTINYDMNREELCMRFLNILKNPVEKEWMSEDAIEKYRKIIESKLENFDITGSIVNVIKGPVITRFEYKPDPGIKLSKISNLTNDLALALKAEKIRVIAPIPGKGVVGIEVPNDNREIVFIKELIDNENFKENSDITYVPIGKNITGDYVYSSISKMPHLLIAGSTGSGKSVFINSVITALLYKVNPNDLRFILIDPKRIELSIYNGIPHLIRTVISDQATSIYYLNKVLECMEKRYEEFARVGVRDIEGYNNKVKDKKPYIFLIVDELADLMMRSGREVEHAVIRLAQMSRAVGIHLILATQRPSVDVITGLIKANFPARIAFQVASRHDSKTIMDFAGAEQLLGNGDMLYTPPEEGIAKRLHGPYITTEETKELVYLIGLRHLRNLLKREFQDPDSICMLVKEEDMIDVIADRSLPGAGERIEEFSKLLYKELNIEEERFTEFIDELNYYPITEEIDEFLEEIEEFGELGEVDEFYEEAKRIVVDRQSASVSLLQRKLKIGYARAGRIIDQLEKAGIVSKFKGSKPRDVLIKPEDLE
jgi:S-DNA-T family DNA segregation ATPase FtsK/SpoIIIE